MEETTKKALDLLEQSATFAKGFIEKHGPQAWDSVLWVYTINGIHWLVFSVFMLIVSIVLSYISLKNYLAYRKEPVIKIYIRKEDRQYDEKEKKYYYRSVYDERTHVDNDDPLLRAILFGCVGLVLMFSNFFLALNPWTYVQVFKPELSITQDVMNRVIKR